MKSLSLLILLLPLFTLANDGAFKAAGNHLVPVVETDISVRKEILTIHRTSGIQARIEVYYEFFNPKEAKTIEVGFEAASPYGDANSTPTKNGQPYIHQFTVSLNDAPVAYQVTIVHDSLYYKNGQYKAIPFAKALKESSEDDYVDFMYVYHFRATFKPGLNIIRHTYVVDLSNSVYEKYSLTYILTAAKRWANKKIDDFTLEIDMGEFQDLCVNNSFFKAPSEWTIDSTARSRQLKAQNDYTPAAVEFFVRKGPIRFVKKDFKPMGELNLFSYNYGGLRERWKSRNVDSDSPMDKFVSKRDWLPFSVDIMDELYDPADELSRKILHNLPFARRGYVFKAPELAAYYEKQPWYVPNPAYTPVATELTRKEQEWLLKNK